MKRLKAEKARLAKMPPREVAMEQVAWNRANEGGTELEDAISAFEKIVASALPPSMPSQTQTKIARKVMNAIFAKPNMKTVFELATFFGSEIDA